MVGHDYEIVIRKLIFGVPQEYLPNWVCRRVESISVANLSAYIRPEYRDITYFRGIDFHQDMIDWPKGKQDLFDPSTFITMYVYIHKVSERDSPLHLLLGSHKLGGTVFPHDLTRMDDNVWKYRDRHGNEIQCPEFKLVGPPGYVAMWHSCTLHGTKPITGETDNMRLSLRYLFAKSKKNTTYVGLDDVNSTIDGPLELDTTRWDSNEKGEPTLKENTINTK